MNTAIDNSIVREGIFILPCEFKVVDGGKPSAKGRNITGNSKKPRTEPPTKPKRMKCNIETNTHCYTCGKDTQDVNVLLNDNIRRSNCIKCRISRSVFTNS